MKKTIDKVDNILLINVIILIIIGLIMIYSSSAVIAFDKYGDSAYYFKKQVLFIIIGLIPSFIFFKISYTTLKKLIPLLFFISIVLLFSVQIPGLGKKIGGARRWLDLPFLPAFQPFEVVKLFYVLYLAHILSNNKTSYYKKLIKILLITSIIGIGLIIQPDLGGTIIISILFLFIFFASGESIKPLILLIPFIGFLFYFLIINEPYRLKRIFAFLNPWADPTGAGFQTIQSFIAIGSGGVFGVGLSKGIQKLLYLPTPHTDFIFSVIGEELGFIGSCIILFLILMIVLRGLTISLNLEDKFLKLVACGLTFMISIQALINIGVSVGLLPAKGTTLPFLSFGGSSLVVSMSAISILLSISRKIHVEVKK